MIRGEAIGELVSLLEKRDCCLWHACQFQDLQAYLELGGIPSRALLEQSRLPFTPFETDDADHQNGVWDKVFVNLCDFGRSFAQGSYAVPNCYGPIVFQIHPVALLEASDVAVCLRSAGGWDFNREVEALSTVDQVNRLYRYPADSSWPASAEVRFGDELTAIFPGAKNPEVSCTVANGRLSIQHVVAMYTDPYLIANRSLCIWVSDLFARADVTIRVQQRSCQRHRKALYRELADLVVKGVTSLVSLNEMAGTSEELRGWEQGVHDNGLDYQFRRYATYLLRGTLKPLSSPDRGDKCEVALELVRPPISQKLWHQGSYVDKFSRIMALKRQATPEAINELVAALADEDERIRWLAGSTLRTLHAARVLDAVRAFVARTESETGREAAKRLVRQIAC